MRAWSRWGMASSEAAFSTMGAEKMAPPGMGRRPISAGKKTRSSERERIWARMARMKRSDWPEAEYRALKARMTAMMAQSTKVSSVRSASGMAPSQARGERPKRIASAKLPARMDSPRPSFSRMPASITANTAMTDRTGVISGPRSTS